MRYAFTESSLRPMGSLILVKLFTFLYGDSQIEVQLNGDAMAGIARKASSGSKVTREVSGSRTISASVVRAVAVRLEKFVKRTHWHQSRVIANALDLYTEIPPLTHQRMLELEDQLGEAHVRDVVAAAIERAVDHLEWSTVAQTTAHELEGRLPAHVTETQLVEYTRDAIADSRARRVRARLPDAAPRSPRAAD